MFEKTSLTKQLNLDNQLGTANKPPKLLAMDEYPTWKDRFFNYVIGYDASLWIAVEEEYKIPMDENNVRIRTISKMSKVQRDLFEREKKMFNQLLQGIDNEIQHQFKQFKTTKSLWYALRDWFLGM